VKATVVQARTKISSLYLNLNSDLYSDIVEACGTGNNIPTANMTLYSVQQQLVTMEGTLVSVIDVTSCSSISPIFRRLLFGSTCTESVGGLAWLYSTLLFITILGFMILSTRAAFYNPVIRGRRSKRREKEFHDYKDFMSKFYDTSNWELERIPEFPDNLNTDNTSESGSTSEVSPYATHEGEAEEQSGASVSFGLALAPTICSDVEGSTVTGNVHEQQENMDTGDDDDSYDSTYSVDAGEEQSVSSRSVFSLFMKRRMQTLHQRESNAITGVESHDDILSSMSSSSIFNRFKSRRNFNRGGTLYGTDPLSLNPSTTVRHNPYDHRIDSHEDDESFMEEENDENDSSAGVMLTPQAMRYPINPGQSSLNITHNRQRTILSQSSSEDDVSAGTSPLALEMQPLSPSSIESSSNIDPTNRDGELELKQKGFRWPLFR
jgi:hypothetical protein